jgi:hypothetical protein
MSSLVGRALRRACHPWSKLRGALLAIAAIAGIAFAAAPPAAAAPANTVSYYMDSVSTSYLYGLGFAVGRRVRDGSLPQRVLVILDYGAQTRNASGTWGSKTVDQGAFRTMAQLRSAVQAYGRGFYYGTGTNRTGHLRLVLGTNNSIRSTVTTTGGQIWATSINRINEYFRTHGVVGFRMANQVTAQGGNDIESGFCDCPAASRAWANGYSGVSHQLYFNFGDCAGCPSTFTGIGTTRTSRTWTVDDEYYVSWGAPAAFPLPEIYLRSGQMAAQWERIAEYGHNRYGVTMRFLSSLTQHGSCLQGRCTVGGPLDNTPDAGWGQLWRALNTQSDYPPSNPHPAPAYMHQSIPYSTDIKH